MPCYEYFCSKCNKVLEHWQTKPDGGPKELVCTCGGAAKKIMSGFQFRMNTLFEPGGPVYEDQKTDLGPITGDMQEESAKQQSDYRQACRKGEACDYVFKEK